MSNIKSLPLKQSLMVNALNAPNPFEFVVATQNVYNMPTLAIIYAMNGWTGKQIYTDQYWRAKSGNLSIAAAIDSVAQSGADLIVTLKDASYDLFREGDVVRDSNDYDGLVKSKQAGQVVIQPFTSGALVAATHFIKDSTISVLGNASAARASQGVQSLSYIPDKDYNCYNVVRDSQVITTEDLQETFVKYQGQNWWAAQEKNMLQRLTAQVAERIIWGKRGYQISTNKGLVNSNGGILWSIENRGGMVDPITSDAISLSKINEIVSNIKMRSGKGLSELTFVGGINAIVKIQSVLGPIVAQSGINNTFGGKEVKGFSVPFYSIGFVNCKFVHDPMFDNPGKFGVSSADLTQISGLTGSKKSNSFFVMDTSPVDRVGGGTEPVMEMFYYHKEMSFGYIKGMTDADASNYTEMNYVNANAVDIATDLDCRSCHAIVRNGVNVVDASSMYYYNVVR